MAATVTAYLNLRVPMRDGTELATHVYLPDAEGPLPVVLVRTPYQALGNGESVLDWPSRGFAHVSQDTRGRFLSDGEFYPCFNERNDAEDTLNWIVEQDWCNGNICMYGGSYLSITQLNAAMTQHGALKCIMPCVMGLQFYHACYWGGAFRLSWQVRWTLRIEEERRGEVNRHLPLLDMERLAGEQLPIWSHGLEHPHNGEFWQRASLVNCFGEVNTPAFIFAGWFDFFVCDVFDLYNGLRASGGTDEVRHNTRILVGPWPHAVNKREVGEVDYGEAAILDDLLDEEIAFMKYHVGEDSDYCTDVAPIKIFVMGDNVWREEFEWPLARTVWTDLFLAGDGRLTEGPGDGVDEFDYDPDNPVPTLGGSWDFDHTGSYDQTEIENRADVLVYTGATLTKDMEVTGPVEARLFASSSARDTDFTVKLVDVQPDGRPMSVTDGIIRARYRHQNGTGALLEPGEVYDFSIRCNPTSYVFKEGHRVRLEVSSSNFPAFARNLNTGNDIPTDTGMEVAHQTIHHSREYPSRIVLPVIPRE